MDLRVLIQKASFMRIQKILASDVRRTMGVDEFLDICSSNGVPPEEAVQLLRSLHGCAAQRIAALRTGVRPSRMRSRHVLAHDSVGFLLHFDKSADERVRNTIFLKPEEVTDGVFARFGLESPTMRFVQEQAARKRAELEALETVFKEMVRASCARTRRGSVDAAD